MKSPKTQSQFKREYNRLKYRFLREVLKLAGKVGKQSEVALKKAEGYGSDSTNGEEWMRLSDCLDELESDMEQSAHDETIMDEDEY